MVQKLKLLAKKKNFYKFDNFWIKKKDLKKISFKTKNIFGNIYKFINVKYKWGGKHFSGVDCSGLIQLFFNLNNKFCPSNLFKKRGFSRSLKNLYFPPVLLFRAIQGEINLYLNNLSVTLN